MQKTSYRPKRAARKPAPITLSGACLWLQHDDCDAADCPCLCHAAPVLNFPLLMDVAAEVAAVEAQMPAEGSYWNDDARAWLKKPTFDEAQDGMERMGYSY